MPGRISYELGTFCWADLNAPDPDAATAFYTGLFGWHAHVDPDPLVAGHITLTLDGDLSRPVAALMPMTAEAPPGTPAFWTTYVSVADVDATAELVRGAGGQVFMGPTDAGELGRFALLFDPQGALVGLWQARDFHGAGVIGEPGAYCWSELAVRDVEGARAFYGTVLGWEGDTHASGPAAYTEWRTPGGTPAGWMTQMDERWPAEIPPRWTVTFTVSDCDATAARAAELGGTVAVAPHDIPAGRVALLNDPQGGRFSVIHPNG
ncbi:VOC family protein [Streptosporangium sp. NBC_01495]|uniref:VOC family protein n=1 Tax=Streptosporangium sp. NBC_01495 TaxID=2903899 RepID=UPI002E30F7DC|nr:VOC family protein [Streptosporangium sp. NBC_01495]